MGFRFEHLESAKSLYSGRSAHLVSSIELACTKPNKYYSLTESKAVLYAAHPSMKFVYFDTSWAEHPEWIGDARAKVKNLWESR